MYRIIRDDGMELGITDSILFIKIAENGCFVPSREEDARVLWILNGHG